MVQICPLKMIQTGFSFACTNYVIFGFKVMFSNTNNYIKTGKEEGLKKNSLCSIYRRINVFLLLVWLYNLCLDCTRIYRTAENLDNCMGAHTSLSLEF